ncbi:MFS transporter [Chloroflexota bacterium]
MLRSWISNRELHGWVVVAELLIFLAIVLGIRYSFGVFFKSIESEFYLSRGATSSLFSVYMALSSAFAFLGGWSLDRYGPKVVLLVMGIVTCLSLLLTSQTNSSWQLFISYSLLLAIGTGAGFTVVIATVSKWFVKHRGLALGIGLSGEGLGTLVMAPFAAYLISSFTWRTAFATIGIIAGVVIIGLSLLMKKRPPETDILAEATIASVESSNNRNDSVQNVSFSLAEAFRTRSFWLFGIVYLLFSLSFHLVSTHIAPRATDIGVTAASAAAIVAVIGGCTIPGRLIIGWVSDRISRKVLAILCGLFQVIALIWLAWSGALWMFLLFAVFFGFAFGGLSNLIASLIGDTFGTANIGTITGTLIVGFGLGGALGPVLGGSVFDATSSYFISFLVGALAMSMAVLFIAFTRREIKRRP